MFTLRALVNHGFEVSKCVQILGHDQIEDLILDPHPEKPLLGITRKPGFPGRRPQIDRFDHFGTSRKPDFWDLDQNDPFWDLRKPDFWTTPKNGPFREIQNPESDRFGPILVF